LNIKYKAELSGKMKVMSKKDMRTLGIKSPNCADAFMLTFLGKEKKVLSTEMRLEREQKKKQPVFVRRGYGRI
jgi:hypothetical protein